jgi:hypothetical protein
VSELAPRTPQEFRRFVARHHPDRGGDPTTFAAGVSAYRERQGRGRAPVVFYRRASRRRRLLHHLLRLSPWTPRRHRRHERRAR